MKCPLTIAQFTAGLRVMGRALLATGVAGLFWLAAAFAFGFAP